MLASGLWEAKGYKGNTMRRTTVKVIRNSNNSLIKQYIKYIHKVEKRNDLFKQTELALAKRELRNLLVLEDSKCFI